MNWVTAHKAICALALLAIGCLIAVDLLLGEDQSGMHIFEGNLLFYLLVIVFYAICITGFVIGFRYATIGNKKSKLFWVSMACIVLAGLLTIPASFSYMKNLLLPHPKSIFDGLHLFDISENRKHLLEYQNILLTILSVLQVASVCTLIRLRKLFKAAEV
jgi:hypothetical protein